MTGGGSLEFTFIFNTIQLFYAYFEHRPMIVKLATFVRFSHPSNTVLLPIFIGVFKSFGDT